MFENMLFLPVKWVFLPGFRPEFGLLPAARLMVGGGGDVFDVPLNGAG
ncbi:MAG: hypothetical protein LBK66_07825 [Spirochaetaceae bacterium]|nr:hypothetical protein [Spirochaetaceae bacterium]